MPASSDVEDAGAAARAGKKRGGSDEMQPVGGEAGDRESWKKSRAFLLKLGCITDAGARLPTHDMVSCSIPVSQDYTITGLQLQPHNAKGDGGVDGVDGLRSSSLMEVNHCCLLSLQQAEVFGRVVGLDHRGLAVEKRRHLSAAQEAEVMALMVGSKAPRSTDGYSVFVDSFRPDVRDFVRRHMAADKMVLARDLAGRQLWMQYAYPLKEECLHGVRHNWAKCKLERLKKKLKTVVRRGVGRRNAGVAFMALLCKYVTAAVPVLLKELAPDFPRAFAASGGTAAPAITTAPASATLHPKKQQQQEGEEDNDQLGLDADSSGEEWNEVEDELEKSDDEFRVRASGCAKSPKSRRSSTRRTRGMPISTSWEADVKNENGKTTSRSTGLGKYKRTRRKLCVRRTRSSTKAGYAQSGSSGDEGEEEEEVEEEFVEASSEDEFEEECVDDRNDSSLKQEASPTGPRSATPRQAPPKRCKVESDNDHPQQQPIVSRHVECRAVGNARDECKMVALRGLDGLAFLSVEISQLSELNRSLSFTLNKLKKKKGTLLSELDRLRALHNLQ